MTGNFTIVEARREDASLVAGVIGQAFQHLAVAEWLIDTAENRAPVLTANMTIFVEHALSGVGRVTMTDDAQAVAVWFRHDLDAPPPPPDYSTRLTEACGLYTPRFRILDQFFDDHHPHDTPHHHLAFMATLPLTQGHGRGSALLREHHDTHPGMPAYLEASCPESRALYQRHGYVDLGEPFVLPDGPPMWPMWRGATG